MEQIDRNKMQIIRMGDVSKLSGLSRSTLYEKLNEKSSRYDNSFPKQLKLSRNAVGWLEHEVLEWLDSKAKERFSWLTFLYAILSHDTILLGLLMLGINQYFVDAEHR